MTRIPLWTRWAPLLLVLTGILVSCERTATPAAPAEPAPAPPAPAAPAPAQPAEPAPAEPQATCDDLAIRLLDRGPGIHGAIVADTLHMGGDTTPVTCSEPASQSVAGWSIPDDWTAQAQQSQYYLIVIRYPGGNRIYVVSRRSDGSTCIVNTNDECVAEVSDLADDFDLSDLPDDVAPTIPAGREEPPTPPEAPTAPEEPTAPDTAPAVPGNPRPRNEATGVTVYAPRLSWSAARATSYDLYWGTTKDLAADAALGTPITTSYTPVVIRRPGTTGTEHRLAHETTYYWRVDAKNDAGTTRGNVWSFTTEAEADTPSNPYPRDGATGVLPLYYLNLRWSDVAGATSYVLYWGKTTQKLAAVDGFQVWAPPVATIGGLQEETTYYWRVDAKKDTGTTRGEVWSFTTAAEPPAGTLWIYDESVDEGDKGDEHRTYDWSSPLLWVYWRDHGHPPGTKTKISIKVTGVTATRCVDFTHYDCVRGRIVGQDEGSVESGRWITVMDPESGRRRYGVDVPLDRAGNAGDLAIRGDNIKEEDETFTVTISPVDMKGYGPNPTCGRCSATFTILNDD